VSKPVAFGMNGGGRDKSSQAAEIKTKLSESRGAKPTHNQKHNEEKYSLAIKAAEKSGAEISPLFLISHISNSL